MSKAPLQLRNASNSRLYAERVVLLAEYLDASDEALLRAIYDRGLSAADAAHLLGMPTRRVQRRVRSLLRRLGDPAFLKIVRHRRSWPERARRVAEQICLRGRTTRAAANELGLSIHEVRLELQRIRTLLELLPKDCTAADEHDRALARESHSGACAS